MSQKITREYLEQGFESDLARSISMVGPGFERLRSVLAVNYIINTANDVVRRIERKARDVDSDSLEGRFYVASLPRVRGAFNELMATGTTDYDDYVARVLRTLSRLETPLPAEVGLAKELSDDSVLLDTTEEFKLLREFFEMQLTGPSDA